MTVYDFSSSPHPLCEASVTTFPVCSEVHVLYQPRFEVFVLGLSCCFETSGTVYSFRVTVGPLFRPRNLMYYSRPIYFSAANFFVSVRGNKTLILVCIL